MGAGGADGRLDGPVPHAMSMRTAADTRGFVSALSVTSSGPILAVARGSQAGVAGTAKRSGPSQ